MTNNERWPKENKKANQLWEDFGKDINKAYETIVNSGTSYEYLREIKILRWGVRGNKEIWSNY